LYRKKKLNSQNSKTTLQNNYEEISKKISGLS
jgi:hypothetical protein